MEIPADLLEQIKQGNVVLVLGAGASLSATDALSTHPPDGKKLGELLAKKFLNKKYIAYPLSHIAELSISQTDLRSVQDYIKEIFSPFQPTVAHKVMSTFRWWGIATTNYDLLIEKAYEGNLNAAQTPVPFIEDGDRVDDHMRQQPNGVRFLKLHGCITRTANTKCPLILTVEQYTEHHVGRKRIFSQLYDWAHEHPLIFIGQSLQDPDLCAILRELTVQRGDERPRYYAVAPDVDDIQTRAWEMKKISVLAGTFEEFINTLDAHIAVGFRKLSVPPKVDLPITKHFLSQKPILSSSLLQFLAQDVEYIEGIVSTSFRQPLDFYKGLDFGWSAIEQKLDVQRLITDTILSDHFLDQNHEKLEMILLKAHAGAGKSVLLKRLAWDAAKDYGYLCLFMKPYGAINTAAIQELLDLCNDKRLYLFIDNAADHQKEIYSLTSFRGPAFKNLTLVITERTNEWNVGCDLIAPFVTAEYEIKYLTSNEIDELLTLLAKNRALGTLANLSPEDQKRELSEQAGRQLLVALHEATLGKAFEDIIEDEYKSICPSEAQVLYLTVCVLNRLDIPVRAGLISRMYGIPFEKFKEKLFAPLEHVVIAEWNPIIKDYMYRARHARIAEIVFERILSDSENRYDYYLRILKELNIDYDADRIGFRKMIRARSLMSLFPSHEHIQSIYSVAKELVGDDPYLMQQMGIYEMQRPNGNLFKSGELLAQASRIADHDVSIKHSLAEHALRMAEIARTPLEKGKHLADAENMVLRIKRDAGSSSFIYHTLSKIGLKKLEDIKNGGGNGPFEERLIQDEINKLEKNLADGLQEFPGDPYLLEAESKIAALLSDSTRMVAALKKSFEANPRNSYVAIRLASYYKKTGLLEDSKKVFLKALEANGNERRLHYSYGKLLMELPNTLPEQLQYHFKRSFVPGDKNYDALLLYARQLFVMGHVDEAKALFKQLKNAAVNPEIKKQLRYPLADIFHGKITRVEAFYWLIARDGTNDWVYAYKDNADENLKQKASFGAKVSFRLAFNFFGINAFDIKLS